MSDKINFRLPPNLPELEEATQAFWKKTDAFKKSVSMRSTDNSYVFYDGPPFATGMPHYGHLLASTTKDVFPRYWTMKGFRVERVWGWDCHGLPIENMIEKKLEIKGGKKGIEALGIAAFNEACQAEVLRLDSEWEKIINRLGRWVDFENNYKTMDTSYMESVWWAFKELHQKELIYEGRKVVMYCPRCATPLSNFEIAMDNSYADTEDWSLYLRFKVVNKSNEFVLAWTTTPWSLPGNVALAVDPAAEYVQVLWENNYYWIAQELAAHVFSKKGVEKLHIEKTVLGTELVGLEYQPLFPYLESKTDKKAHYIAAADFVSLEDGTGIVHTAAIFGEDDYRLALELDLPLVPTLDDEGKFLPFVELVSGTFYKKSEATINDFLAQQGSVFHLEHITHSYPFCYRCGTPLYYNAVPAWFIDVQKIKSKLVSSNESINWVPDHLKHGRFGKGLENAPDWNISRSRYWGTPMPVWQAADGRRRIIGSIEELKTWAVDPTQVEAITDIHRQFVDDITVWIDDEKTVQGTRIPEVFDCWVESGSMPFASRHYPFEHQSEFEKNYPAQFISEYIAQTRAWFYCMHVLSVGIFDKPAFENALTTGTILAEDGSKMSKSKKNYPDPMTLINTYGVDSLRLYLMQSVVMKSDNLNFSEKEVSDLRRKVFVIWWNVLSFWHQFADTNAAWQTPPSKPSHVMDRWLLSRIATLTSSVTTQMDAYDVVNASRTLIEFVNELSTWYLRLSRERIKADENTEVSQVFGYTLYTLAQLFAPIAPFFPELVHQTMINDQSSIHHTDWPKVPQNWQQPSLEAEMTEVRQAVEKALALRNEVGIKVRQPLALATIYSPVNSPQDELLKVIAQEINVKQVVWNSGTELRVELDINLTAELKAEGAARDLIRQLQNLRKKAGTALDAEVAATAPSWPKDWEAVIMEKAKLHSLTVADTVALV